MKKTIFTLLVLFISISITAQKGNPEKSAKKVADEMTEVLSLNEDDSKNVYEIQLDKFKAVLAVKKENNGDKEKSKPEIKKVTSKTQESLIALLGKEKMTTWKSSCKVKKKEEKIVVRSKREN